MKKLICSLIGLFMSVSAFADGDFAIGSSGVVKTVTSTEIFIPRLYIEKIAEYDPESGGFFNKLVPDGIVRKILTGEEKSKEITPDAARAMLAKYDELADTAVINDNVGAILEGRKSLSVNDMMMICLAGGIEDKNDCRSRVINPILSSLDNLIFKNVCEDRGQTGGSEHCVDGTFTTEYRIPGTGTKTTIDIPILPEITLYDGNEKVESSNSYAQDVKVGKNLAFGFAIEYAKRKGHSVLCNSEIHNNWVNCVTPDLKHFYTFKFADTTADGKLVGHSIERGICALFDTEYHDFLPSHGYVYCGMNCSKGTYPNKVIPKFGVDIVDEYWVDKEKECPLDNRENWLYSNDLKTYPGYEYMSYAFDQVQVHYDWNLRVALQSYVQAQGISFNSFECDYGWRHLARATSNGSVPYDYVIRCRVDETPVDFVFDDLVESRESTREIGWSGVQCVFMKNARGESATFDGKSCRGITKNECLGYIDENGNRVPGLNDMIAGGTTWDTDKGICVMNDAAAAARLTDTLWNVGGVIVTVGLVIVSGGTVLIGLVAVAAEVAVDALADQIERQLEMAPYVSATEFIDDASSCGISGTPQLSECNKAQRQCAYDAIHKFYKTMARYEGILDKDVLEQMDYYRDQLIYCVSQTDENDAISGALDTDFDDVKMSMGSFVLIGVSLMPYGKGRGIRVLSRSSRAFGGAKNFSKHVWTARRAPSSYSKLARGGRNGWFMDISKRSVSDKVAISEELQEAGFHHVIYDGRGRPIKLTKVDGDGNVVSRLDANSLKDGKTVFYTLDNFGEGLSFGGREFFIEGGKASFGTKILRDGPEYLAPVVIGGLALQGEEAIRRPIAEHNTEKGCRESGGEWIAKNKKGQRCDCSALAPMIVADTEEEKCVDDQDLLTKKTHCESSGGTWVMKGRSVAECDCGKTRSLDAKGYCEDDENKLKQDLCETSGGKWEKGECKCSNKQVKEEVYTTNCGKVNITYEEVIEAQDNKTKCVKNTTETDNNKQKAINAACLQKKQQAATDRQIKDNEKKRNDYNRR